ncbi:MAG: hypothetical protein ACR2NY_03265 [Alphaproteobacteria bacterium]
MINQKQVPSVSQSLSHAARFVAREYVVIFKLGFIMAMLNMVNLFFFDSNYQYQIIGIIRLPDDIFFSSKDFTHFFGNVFSLLFFVGWLLFLHGNIGKRRPLFDTVKKIKIIWRTIWRSFVLLLFVMIFSLLGLFLSSILYFMISDSALVEAINHFFNHRYNNDANYAVIIIMVLGALLPALLMLPVLFLVAIDIVLHYRFRLLLWFHFYFLWRIWVFAWLILLVYGGYVVLINTVMQWLLDNHGLSYYTIGAVVGSVFLMFVMAWGTAITYGYWRQAKKFLKP